MEACCAGISLRFYKSTFLNNFQFKWVSLIDDYVLNDLQWYIHYLWFKIKIGINWRSVTEFDLSNLKPLKIYFLKLFFSQIIRVVSIFSKLPFRGIATNRVTFNGNILSCWKKCVYQNTVVKSDETSTYQELYMSENAYQNTTIRW